MSISNIEKIKNLLLLQQQVKEILQKDFVDLHNPLHFTVIRQVLEKEKKQKNENDLLLLSMAFSNIKFFLEMSKTTSQEEMLLLYKELSFIQLPARRTLFNFGDIGKNFYIILTGSVWVLVARSGLGNGTFITNTADPKSLKQLNSFEEGEQADENEFSEYDDEKMLQLKYPNLMKVGQVESEGSFGEIALTNFIPRQATIVCREDTQFIRLSREAFNKFLSEYYNRLQQRNFNFLKQVQIFAHWQDAELSQIQYHLQPIEYRMNDLIYKEGEQVNGVYFIQEGQVELSESMHIKKESVVPKSSIRKSISMRTLQIKLSRLGYGQVFGYFEIQENVDYRESRAVCLTEKVKLLFITADRFKLYCKDDLTQNELNKLMDKQVEKKNKSKQIYLGTNESQGSIKNQSISIDQTSSQIDLTITDINTNKNKNNNNNNNKNSKFGRKNKNSWNNAKELLGNIAHQSSKIQNYQMFLQNHHQLINDQELTFEKPLIEIQLSHKIKAQQQQQSQNRILDMGLQNNKQDSRITLIQKLKLPKIYRNPLKVDDDVQIQVYKYVRSKNLSKFY